MASTIGSFLGCGLLGTAVVGRTFLFGDFDLPLDLLADDCDYLTRSDLNLSASVCLIRDLHRSLEHLGLSIA